VPKSIRTIRDDGGWSIMAAARRTIAVNW